MNSIENEEKELSMEKEIKVYRIVDLMDENLTNGSKNMVTRETGRIIREAIEVNIQKEQEEMIIILDFSGIGIIDFSCADEVAAKFIARLNLKEYGDKYLLFSGLTPSQEENITAALEKKKLSLLSLKENGGWKLMGILNPYLKDTLDLVMARKSLTARELADLTGVEINSASTKLLNLNKARLAIRVREALPNGGRQFVYRSLISLS
ncbi:MAG: hypothetical protein J7K02_10125 [Deltaproteobacteria bacterium]|nr:hypothetical protein [Deltaproteobacteria bacterium]